MSVNWQFFGKICIRVTPADQFNNRIWGWVYWGLFLGRSVRWKNWGKIVYCEGERDEGPMGAMLAGAAGDATKYRPEYSRHQIRKSSSSISMKADQILSWNIKAEQNVVFLVSCLKCKQSPKEQARLSVYLPFILPVLIGVFVIYWVILFLCPIGWLGFVRVVPWSRSSRAGRLGR